MDQTVKDKVRCHFMIDNHHRCKRNTIIYSYFCWQHTIKKEHLKLEPSLIAGAGKGLFTTAPLKKGDVIRYSGQMLTKAQFEQRYPLDNADYVIQLGANRFLDGRSTQNQLYSNPPGKKPTLGRWANKGSVASSSAFQRRIAFGVVGRCSSARMICVMRISMSSTTTAST